MIKVTINKETDGKTRNADDVEGNLKSAEFGSSEEGLGWPIR